MANVTHYTITFYGTSDGYQDMRAQIQLLDGTTVLGWVRFHDPGGAFPEDSEANGKLTMHLPLAAFPSIVDLLRNEKPLKFYTSGGHAFLGTTESETIGKGDK